MADAPGKLVARLAECLREREARQKLNNRYGRSLSDQWLERDIAALQRMLPAGDGSTVYVADVGIVPSGVPAVHPPGCTCEAYACRFAREDAARGVVLPAPAGWWTDELERIFTAQRGTAITDDMKRAAGIALQIARGQRWDDEKQEWIAGVTPCADTYGGCAPDCHEGNRCRPAGVPANVEPAPAGDAELERLGARIAASDALHAFVCEYLEGYELRGDGGDHEPTEFEVTLIADAVAGLIGEDEFIRRLHAWDVLRTFPAGVSIPRATCKLCGTDAGNNPHGPGVCVASGVKASAPAEIECPECLGTGVADNTDDCARCRGTGVIPAPSVPDLRQRFEAWAGDQGYPLKKLETSDGYLDLRTHGAWEAWEACAATGVAACGNTPYDEGPFTIASGVALPSVPLEAVSSLLRDVLAMPGMNSRTAPDYAVEVALWLSHMPVPAGATASDGQANGREAP